MAGLGLQKKHVLNKLIEDLLIRIERSTTRSHEGKVTYVIGNNGTGKSRVLGELAERFKSVNTRRVVACIANSLHDRFVYANHEKVIYLGARNAPNAVFQAASERQLARFILQSMQIDRRLFGSLCKATNTNITFSLDKKLLHILSSPDRNTRERERVYDKAVELGLLTPRPLGIIKRIASGVGKFDRLTPAQVPVLLQLLELSVKFDLYVTLRDGRVISFGGLSTGEQNRIMLFAKVLSVMKEGTVFLIDEPEVSLHLHWQMKFHKTLMDLLKKLKRFHVVVATHAPIVISEAAKIESANHHNSVAVLRHNIEEGTDEAELGPGIGEMTCQMHSFPEVASHDQLVLRYFHTAPYHAREVAVEVTDAVLSVAETSQKAPEALSLLKDLLTVQGLSKQGKSQIAAAIDLVRRGVPALAEEGGSR